MDGRSWSPGSAVRKEDQFTAAPDFLDPHDSEHLPMWGRLQASWHGAGPRRQLLVASSVFVLAGMLALGVLALMAQPGPSQGGSQGPLADQRPDGPLPTLPSGPPQNLTSSAPGPLPTPLPSGAPVP